MTDNNVVPAPAAEKNRSTATEVGQIRRVLRTETHLIAEHFLRLDADARGRRFGHNVSDHFIQTYTLHAADLGNLAFAHFHDGDIHAVAELRQSGRAFGHTAEVAFSVERAFANKGIGTELMGRVIRAARNRRLKRLLLVCLRDNVKMQAIARHYGAELSIDEGSIIADIIPQTPDYASIASEIFDDRMVFMQSALDWQTRLSRLT